MENSCVKASTFVLIASSWFLNPFCYAQLVASDTVAQHFETIKLQPKKMKQFLWDMPKGGDLHNHMAGATFAENLIQYAQGDQFCIDRNTYTVFDDPNCSAENLLDNAVKTPSFYNNVIDAWSMRNFKETKESGHDHFFATFGKFYPIVEKHPAQVLAEIRNRAQLQNESYLELQVTLDGNKSGILGKQLGWNAHFETMREKLLSHGLDGIVKRMSQVIDENEANVEKLLNCKRQPNNAGCDITVRYLYQVFREQAPEMVFAQLLAGFTAASNDKRIVGVNMVQPEDGSISMRDYALHMQMVKFLHKIFPHVFISLHAGELTEKLVPLDGLQFHIKDAVTVASANRIGHGVDLLHEKNYKELLTDMSKKKILVEINLSSNDMILNALERNYPLQTYLKYHVPLALSTDDEGISRANLTQQYVLAVNKFNLDYPMLKTFARNSLAYSFLPGKGLWIDNDYKKVTSKCKFDRIGSMKPSTTCRDFLNKNEKANIQWNLESRFVRFERRF
jgi:adenosine deaminase